MFYHKEGTFFMDGAPSSAGDAPAREARKRTLAYRIMSAHEKGGSYDGGGTRHMVFDGMLSHDITYVNIIQTAKASGMEKFPLEYTLTNCHNSLCAVGGTINEDDHIFGLSAAKKYGGNFVPANVAVIHQYAREQMAACGKMILGSDSHTRYGALGTMAIGEGGPELVKQLLQNTYDIKDPDVVLIYVTGKLRKGVGPHDVALLLCREVFGTVKNQVLEFAGPGIAGLSMEDRIGIDVMTTETSCLSSIWQTDSTVEEYFANHRRPEAYRRMQPENGAYYDHWIDLDLSKVEPMIALPFHPSNAFTIREVKADPHKYLDPLGLGGKVGSDGQIHVDQGEIAGCAGGLFENIHEAADILRGCDVGNGEFGLNIYPASMPLELALAKDGTMAELLGEGAVFKPAFCGPCFGAGDVPGNNGFSVRHTTRNFPNREGSKPGEGQKAFVALMDARSIAATARNHGVLTGADEIDYEKTPAHYGYNPKIYEKRVYHGWQEGPKPDQALVYGPNIRDWPEIPALKDDLLVQLAAVIRDAVTTTDELIPSGETSSYRSNPIRLSEFALSRREPAYVGRTKEIRKKTPEELGFDSAKTSIGSAIYCVKPGDGSAREQAASCQRVLGGAANFCREYATKRYRSNVINWGMLPFTVDGEFPYETWDWIYVPGIRQALLDGKDTVTGYAVTQGALKENPEKKGRDLLTVPVTLHLGILTDEERRILLAGCLINRYQELKKQK
ncbi:MAG: hydratase [Lachnospiraceae bacterium]|jgi:aconitate hydratase